MRSAVVVVFLAGGVVASVPGTRAASGADVPRPRKEKLEYDPTAGQWVVQEAPVPGTPDGDLRLARADFAAGDHRDADRRIRAWIKTYGDAHELYPEAALLRAEVEVGRRDYYKAHKHLQELLGEFAGSRYADRAIELEFVIAEVFLGGTKRKLLGLPILPAEEVGTSILDDLAGNYPGTSVAEAALKTKADYYYRKGDFTLAEIEYAALVKDFPRSRYVRYGMRRSAESALASFPGVEYDDAPLIEAEERFRDYIGAFPGTAEQEGIGLILDDIASQRAQKEYEIGRYYQRVGRSRAATFYYRSTVRYWPDTIAATRAKQRLEKLGRPLESPLEPIQPSVEPAIPAAYPEGRP